MFLLLDCLSNAGHRDNVLYSVFWSVALTHKICEAGTCSKSLTHRLVLVFNCFGQTTGLLSADGKDML